MFFLISDSKNNEFDYKKGPTVLVKWLGWSRTVECGAKQSCSIIFSPLIKMDN